METENYCTKSIQKTLIAEMKTGVFSTCEKLPRETVLSEQLGISRTQLRDALAELEREGFITRRHGVGTLINRHVLQIKNRMDIETEYMDMIRQNGYEPKVESVSLKEELVDAAVAAKLQIPEGTEVVRVCRLCTADGKPAIYCEDVLEKCLVKGDFAPSDLEPSIFYFLRNFCGINAYMDVTELHAVAANEVVAEALKISTGTPILNMEEVDFDIDGRPVFYSSQYFVDGLFQQAVLRKKL